MRAHRPDGRQGDRDARQGQGQEVSVQLHMCCVTAAILLAMAAASALAGLWERPFAAASRAVFSPFPDAHIATIPCTLYMAPAVRVRRGLISGHSDCLRTP